jgi:hypothetical protein
MKKNKEKYVAATDLIRNHLEYNRETGIITWKKPRTSNVKLGSEAGCRKSVYVMIKIGGHQLYAHVVAWFLATGSWPDNEIDHRNLIKHDNRFENLRQSTRAQNSCNRKAFSKTGAGLKGAYTHESMNGKWFGQIVVEGRQIHLGRFDTEQEAHEAYISASKKYHGEFSRI